MTVDKMSASPTETTEKVRLVGFGFYRVYRYIFSYEYFTILKNNYQLKLIFLKTLANQVSIFAHYYKKCDCCRAN